MNEYLVRVVMARPFEPFTLILSGGHSVDVLHPELIVLTRHIEMATVYDPVGRREYIQVDKIASIRTIRPVGA